MPPFPKPRSSFDYDLDAELAALREHRKLREVPPRRRDRLLLGTWNIANFGVQKRREKDHFLLAEIVGWFDLIAIQEVAENLADLYAVRNLLPESYRLLVSDTAGNDERAAFLYDSRKVEALELVGRLSIPPSDFRHIKLTGVEQAFQGFDRPPYLTAFRAGSLTLLLASVHLFYGSDQTEDLARRSLETYAVARWADLSRHSRFAFTRDIVPLGDFNLPRVHPDDPIYRALTSRGLAIPPHSTAVGGSSLGGDHQYDQIAFFPGEMQELNREVGTFDFDNALFRDLWTPKRPQPFFAYTRYYVSDHRPLWAEFATERGRARADG